MAVRRRTQPVAGQNPSMVRVLKVTWACLTHGTRRKIVASGLAAAFLAGMDAVAIGLLPRVIDRLQQGAESTGGLSTPALSVIVGGLLLAKSAGGALLVRWQGTFVARDESERTIGLFSEVLHRPYGETSGTNSNDLIRDLHLALPKLYRGAAYGLSLLIADALSLAGLVLVVVVESAVAGLMLFVFLVVAAQFYATVIRRRIHQLGNRLHEGDADCLVDLSESFGGLKTLKAFGVEDAAIERFSGTRDRFAGAVRGYLVYAQLSRVYMEAVLVLGLGACLGAVYAIEGRAAVVTAFGLLAGAAARAMPALTRLLISITQIKLAGPAVLSLEPDLRLIEHAPLMESTAVARDLVPSGVAAGDSHDDELDRAGANRTPLVKLAGVHFRYPEATADALSDVSLELERGELVAIVGGSGMGKTTLVDVLIGLLVPQGGSVERGAAGRVGYVAQDTFVWDDSVRFNVGINRRPLGPDLDAEIWTALELAQLADWVRTLPDGLDTTLGERGNRMSGGQRQRLGLARALFGRPSILVLDEPTSALDGETSRALLKTLAELKHKIGLVVVTHDPIVMEFGDRIVTLGPPTGDSAVLEEEVH